MTKQQIFKAAHQIAKHTMSLNMYSSYRAALSNALLICYREPNKVADILKSKKQISSFEDFVMDYVSKKDTNVSYKEFVKSNLTDISEKCNLYNENYIRFIRVVRSQLGDVI